VAIKSTLVPLPAHPTLPTSSASLNPATQT